MSLLSSSARRARSSVLVKGGLFAGFQQAFDAALAEA
jgi:hypothetical protein